MKILILLCACNLILPSLADSPYPGWRWVREDPKGHRMREGTLELRAQKARIWSGTGARNILVEKKTTEGRTASVLVSHVEPETKYEQGGLLVYRDDDHFVKYINEFIEGDYYVVLAREVGGKGQVFAKIKVEGKSTGLRLKVEGNKVVASYAMGGGARFKVAGQCGLPGAGQSHFALFTQDGSDEKVRWIRFSNLKITGQSGTGERLK